MAIGSLFVMLFRKNVHIYNDSDVEVNNLNFSLDFFSIETLKIRKFSKGLS